MGFVKDASDTLFGKSGKDLAKENAKSAINQSQKFYQQFLSQFIEPAQDRQSMMWDVALGYAEDIPGILEEGFEGAQGALSRFGTEAAGQILDQGANATASMDQRFAGSGLYGSTAHAGAVGGVSSNTQRALASLQAALGQQSAGIETQKAGAVAGAYGNLANLQTARAGHDLGFLGTQLNAAMGAPVFANPGGPHPAMAFGQETVAKIFGAMAGGGAG